MLVSVALGQNSRSSRFLYIFFREPKIETFENLKPVFPFCRARSSPRSFFCFLISMASLAVFERVLDFCSSAFHNDFVIDDDLNRCKTSNKQYLLSIEFAECLRRMDSSSINLNIDLQPCLTRLIASLSRRHRQQEEYILLRQQTDVSSGTPLQSTSLYSSPPPAIEQQQSHSLGNTAQSPARDSSPMYPSPLLSETSSSSSDSESASSSLQWSTPDDMQVSKPVFGCEAAKAALNDAISLPLTVPRSMLKGIRSIGSTGILLYGPPGTGKTSLARQASVDFHLPLLVVTPGMVVSKWAGESEKKIRLIFEQATQRSPCLLFFDELDALAYGRSENSDDDAANRRLLAELLMQLSNLLETDDGSASNVVVMGATNRLDDLDPAVQRRFSSRVFVGNPNQQARVQLLSYGLEGIQVEKNVDLESIASQLEGWSGADVFSVCREAALRPVRRYHEAAKKQQQQERSSTIELEVDAENEKRIILVKNLTLDAVNKDDFDHAVSSVVPVHMSKSQTGRTV